MNATPPEASTEYSSQPGAAEGVSGARSKAAGRGPVVSLIVLVTVVGSVLLIVADFTELYSTHGQVTGRLVATYGTGAHHDYAMAVIGAFCLFLAFGVWTAGSRPALLAIGLLAVLALAIALLEDLPDANGSGLKVLRAAASR